MRIRGAFSELYFQVRGEILNTILKVVVYCTKILRHAFKIRFSFNGVVELRPILIVEATKVNKRITAGVKWYFRGSSDVKSRTIYISSC